TLQGVRPFRLPLNHIHHLLTKNLPLCEPSSPVISSTPTIRRDKDVLRVEQPPMRGAHDGIHHSWLKINHNRPRYVVIIISLVEEDILPVPCCLHHPSSLTHIAICGDAMLRCKLLPEFIP